MINFKNKKLSIDIASILIMLIPLCSIFLLVSFWSGGLGFEHPVSNAHVSEQGEFSADVTITPGWTWRLFGWETLRDKWKMTSRSDLDTYFSITAVEILSAKDHYDEDRFSTTCTAIITYNTGDKVTRAYLKSFYNDNWIHAKLGHAYLDNESLKISIEFGRRTMEVVDVQERTDIGWTYYEAVLTLKNGTQLVRKYIAKEDDGWYRYPVMTQLDTNSGEYWDLMRAYDSRCAQSIFGAPQKVVTESE